MKKVITSLVLSFLVTSGLYASNTDSTSLVCTSSNIASFLENNRYFDLRVSASDLFPTILLDTQSVKIDRKKKIIEAWTILLSSDKGRAFLMSNASGFDSFGYAKHLKIYDYSKMRIKTKAASYFNCDHIPIYSEETGEWGYIEPGSTDEMIMQAIMKKYNLK